jgi:ATP-binding cassette subfamily B protein
MSKKNNVKLKDYFRIAKWSFRINWEMSPSLTIFNLITTIYQNISGLINTYIIAKVIDQIILLVQTKDTDIRGMYPFILLMTIFLFVNIVMSALDSYSIRIRNRLSYPFVSRLVYEKIFSLGVQTNQLPSVSNKKKIAEEWIFNISNLNIGVVRMIASFIRVILSAIIVFSFSFWLGIILIIIAIISYFNSRNYLKKAFEWQRNEKNLEGSRKAWSISSFLTNGESMGEVSLVGAYSFLDSKYTNFFNNFIAEYKRIIKAETITTFLVDILNLFVVIGGSIYVFVLTLMNKISIGNTTFYISSLNNFYDGIKSMITEFVYFSDSIMKGKEVLDFFDLKPLVPDGNISLGRLLTPPSIEVKNISFHYPNSRRNIFENFSLKIEPGEKVAIVGENGAGKSTLVKLFCRLYDPQKGQILINGIDLKDLSINDWYKNVGALFQDFNFYYSLSALENIYIGRPSKPLDKKLVIKSARNAQAHDSIMKLKHKYKNLMSDSYKDGITLSKGQKQKIAIARFFYRDAPFAIFDEPTSAIDTDSEFKIFNRIYNFFNNKTVVIISHRFSTVRKADKIFVIKEGKIVEQGNHKELMDKKGLYFKNFNKQAQGYNSD